MIPLLALVIGLLLTATISYEIQFQNLETQITISTKGLPLLQG